MSAADSITPAAPYLLAHGAPKWLVAIFDALRFDEPSISRLRTLELTEWERLLEWCDARQLTLMLPSLCGDALPSDVQSRIDKCHLRFGKRFSRLKDESYEIIEALDYAGIESIVLKGLTHSPAFVQNPLLRAQGDIDLWIRAHEINEAHGVLTRLGYSSFEGAKSRHVPPMLRPNGWKWRGDRFDPEMPVAVELHYELWSERVDRISAPGTDDFWQRSASRTFDGHALRTLCDEDLLGFAALHLLVHLLHGDLPMQRAWEIANFLYKRAYDETFWTAWERAHPPGLRKLELIIFQLVRAWFGCPLSDTVRKESETLSARVRHWLRTFPFSPLMCQFSPNKDELWLHLALISPLDHTRILGRRLFPLQIPGFVDELDDRSRLRTLRRIFRQRSLIASRAFHHFRTFLPTMFQGARWFLLRKG